MISNELLLLPQPQSVIYTGGIVQLPERGKIILEGAGVQETHIGTESLLRSLQKAGLPRWEIQNVRTAPDDSRARTGDPSTIWLGISPDSIKDEQGYEISITEEGIEGVANTPAGIFYAVQSMVQLIEQTGGRLPCLHCRDWPDYPNRGVMLDISRDKVPTMETLYAIVDRLSSWKINQFQLYTEHTFAYRNHPVVWADASPITAEEAQALDRYCRERFIELVPNQNSFGHMQRWLVHEPYRQLAECPTGCDTTWGYIDGPFSLAPVKPDSIELIRSLYDELLPNFTSRQINVGCDETVDLGQGQSRELVARLGSGRVYLDFLLQIYREVRARDRTMQFWGDIVMEHPELVEELPPDVVALEWGYEAKHPFDKHGALFAKSEIPFYVCPGTSSWNSVAGRTDNAISNLSNAAKNGLKHGATGYLNTDWGDNGHWQPLPVSYLGYAYGAAVSWAGEANSTIDVPKALNLHAFKDSSGVMGQVAFDLGNVHEETKLLLPNKTVLFRVLQSEPDEIVSLTKPIGEADGVVDRFEATLAVINSISSSLNESQMEGDDANLVEREFAWVVDMLRHACGRVIWAVRRAQGIEDMSLRRRLAAEGEALLSEHEVIWHARNRPGGFVDSQARLKKMADAYRDS